MLAEARQVARHWRRLRRRSKALTTAQLVLDLASQVLTACLVLIPFWWAVDKIPSSDGIPSWWYGLPVSVYVYTAAAFYVPAYRMYLVRRFRNKRLDLVEKERPLILSRGIAALTRQLRETAYQDWSHAQRKILLAILGEVEALVGDAEGVYVEVNLLVPHPTDDNLMRCIERAKGRRDLPMDYPKTGMIAWRSMNEVKRQHEPDYTPERKQAYHSILCFPLYLVLRDSGEKEVFGAVSIDHGRAYEFDGMEDEMEERVSPYLRLLEHQFVLQIALSDEVPRAPRANAPRGGVNRFV